MHEKKKRKEKLYTQEKEEEEKKASWRLQGQALVLANRVNMKFWVQSLILEGKKGVD